MRERTSRRPEQPTDHRAAPVVRRRSSRTSGLVVGAVDDPAEHEADRMASTITQGLGLGSRPAPSGDVRSVPTAMGGPLSEETARVLRSAGGGRPLDPAVSQRVQPLVGVDLSSVRVHTGTAADTVARAIDAKAFTVGSDLYFRDGAYSPTSSDGMHTLAHELGHVAQDSPRVHRFLDFIGKARGEGDITLGDGADALAGWEDVANQIHTAVRLQPLSESARQTALDSSSGVGAFGDSDDVKRGMGAPAALGQVLKIGGGLKTGVQGAKHLHQAGKAEYAGGKGSSILGNLGAQQMESGATDIVSGGSDLGVNITANLVAKNVPGLDVVSSIRDAALNTKGAIEDSTAAAKLQGQKRKLKHELDQEMPMDLRLQRFQSFLGGKVKRGEVGRYDKVKAEWAATLNLPKGTTVDAYLNQNDDPQHSHKQAFLTWLVGKGKGYEDFGYGTEIRDGFDAKQHAGTNAEFANVRNLGKVASFAHRRKAETATFKSVDAAGNALDAAGTFTAAADFGTTKVVGKAVKATSSSVKGVKSLVKRARRVHKLRTAKNQMEYGGKSDRGFAWGLGQFLAGDIGRSQGRALAAAEEHVELEREKQQRAALTPLYDAWKALSDQVADVDDELTQVSGEVSDAQQDEQIWNGQVTKSKPGARGRADAEANLRAARAELATLLPKQKALQDRLADLQSQEHTAEQALVTAAATANVQLGANHSVPGVRGPAGKSVGQVVAPDRLAKLLKTQLERRFENLLDALANPKTQPRAIAIIKTIANTNLAGALRKIEDADLQHLAALHADPSKRGDRTYVALKDALHETFQRQLNGIGG